MDETLIWGTNPLLMRCLWNFDLQWMVLQQAWVTYICIANITLTFLDESLLSHISKSILCGFTLKRIRAWRPTRARGILWNPEWGICRWVTLIEPGMWGVWARTAALEDAMLESVLGCEQRHRGQCLCLLPNSAVCSPQLELPLLECLFFLFVVTPHRHIVLTLRWFEAKSGCESFISGSYWPCDQHNDSRTQSICFDALVKERSSDPC